MRTIDADAMKGRVNRIIEVNHLDENAIWFTPDWVKMLIEDAPTIESQRAGRWIPQKGGGLCCSECGGYALDEPDGNFVHVAVPSKFCPHCGARMEGDEE